MKNILKSIVVCLVFLTVSACNSDSREQNSYQILAEHQYNDDMHYGNHGIR